MEGGAPGLATVAEENAVLFSDDVAAYLFTKRMAAAEHVRTLTATGFACLKAHFLHVNMRARRVAPSLPAYVPGNSNTAVDGATVAARFMRGDFEVAGSGDELDGIETLWAVALSAEAQEVADAAVAFLMELPRKVQHGGKGGEDVLDCCRVRRH